MATTITRRSAKRGLKAQKMFESVKGFTNAVSLEMKANGIESEYFADIYIGYLADKMKLQKAEGEDIKSLDKRADDLAAAEFEKKLQSEEGRAELEQSEVFKTLADAEKMYSVFRASLPCFTSESGKFNFAKKKIIAYSAEELTKEEKAEFEAKETWHKVVVMNQEGSEGLYFTSLAFSPESLAEGLKNIIKQRRDFLKEEKEAAKYWTNANGDICALVPIDKANYKDLARAVSGTLQEAAAAIIRRHAEEAEAASNAKKAAAAAAAFLNTAAPEKLAKLADIAAAVAKQKEEKKYNKKAKESAKKQTNGILKYMKDNGDAAANYYGRLSDEADKAADKAAAEGDAKAEAEGRAKAAELFDNEKAARNLLADAVFLSELILNEETAAAELKKKAESLAKRIAAAKEAAAKQEAAAKAEESAADAAA